MLSCKDNQAVKPLYDRYNDTDNDNAGDQLVDFSKRYPENDPEEVCPPSSAKKPQLSISVMSCEESKIDELKHFCDEGTPGFSSSASSSWDLREVGVIKPISETLIPEEQTTKECCFSSPPDFAVGLSNSGENGIASNLTADEAEKGESNNEGEYLNPGETKLSSPLMFSRSSSVCSLNSCEQQSIVDDRSSVSVFSNLPSGLISPSEIPDSPCGIESPFISKSKNNEFIFPSNDKPENQDLIDRTIRQEDFPNEPFGNSDAVKVFNDEGDCSSVSNLSALSIQASSSHHLFSLTSLTQNKNDSFSLIPNSSVTVNCPIDGKTSDLIENCQHLNLSNESYMSEKNCVSIKSGPPLDVKNISQNEKSQSATKYEDKGTSTSEDFNFQDDSYKWPLFPFKDMKKLNEKQYLQQSEDKQIDEAELERIVTQFKELMVVEGPKIIENFLLHTKSANYSKDNSVKESDSILQQYILNGLSGRDSSIFNDTKPLLNHSFQTSGSSMKDNMPNPSISDNDISGDEDDDDDGILNECVLLGMPQKSNSVQIETDKSSVLETTALCNNATGSKSLISETPTHQLKIFENSYQSTMDDIKDLTKSDDDDDDDSDIDESDLLVQQCIQLGRSELKSPKPPAETKLCVIPSFNNSLGRRDNWPDGVSDGEDDDDDILSEIIQAGKPDSTNNSPYAASTPYLKPQNQKRLTAAEDRALYLNKDYSNTIPNYGNIMPKEVVRTPCASTSAITDIDDSMYVFRTEDTPILSPSASLSDLSTLSFTEDKVCQDSFLNNSRNSDCSSDSEDDEMLLQCIRQGMPGGRKVVA